MFKFSSIIVLLLAVHFISARPQDPNAKPPVPIVSQSQTLDGTGTFQYAFESGDGIKEEASGQLKTIQVPQVDPATGQTTGTQEGQGKRILQIIL
jgi:hypothetical protein